MLNILENTRTGKLYSEWDRVQKGDIIAKLSNAEFILSNRMEAKKMEYDFLVEELKQTEGLYEKGGATLKEVQNVKKNLLHAKLNYENAVLQEKKLEISASISGMITFIDFRSNAKEVTVGTEIVKIMDFDKLISKLKLSVDDLEKVKIGQKVKVTNYSLEDKIFNGSVNNILPVLDPESRTVEVEIIMDNSESLLKPGMFIRADIITQRRDNVIKIPKYLILNRNDKDVVFTVDKQQAIMNDIETGLEDEEMIEIISGIDEGARIVVRGYETLKNKVKVKIAR
ncbi:efflux RND transporter periplasmic adaptor subunit [candidate division KSB1 bacterium]